MPPTPAPTRGTLTPMMTGASTARKSPDSPTSNPSLPTPTATPSAMVTRSPQAVIPRSRSNPDSGLIANSITDFTATGTRGRKQLELRLPERHPRWQGPDELRPRDGFIPFPTDYWTGTGWDWPAGDPPWTEILPRRAIQTATTTARSMVHSAVGIRSEPADAAGAALSHSQNKPRLRQRHHGCCLPQRSIAHSFTVAFGDITGVTRT